MTREELAPIILSLLRVRASTPKPNRRRVEVIVDEQTTLLRHDSFMDSLELVEFTFDVEIALEERGIKVNLLDMDVNPLSRRESPFVSVGTYIDFCLERIHAVAS